MADSQPVLDHLGLWCHDLTESSKNFAAKTGLNVQTGGRHEGFGTWNALAGAGEGFYLELVARDPSQSARGRIIEAAETLPDLSCCLLAYRHDDLDGLAEIARAHDFNTPGPFEMSRKAATGETISWRILFLDHVDHGVLPFFIDWQKTPHPSIQLGHGGRVEDLAITARHADRLAKRLDALGIDLDVKSGERDLLSATVHGPAGMLSA